MSKGRFPSHSQHPLTACVPCTVKLCSWDTPPTIGGQEGGGALTVRAPRGPTQGTLCPARRRHTHICNWSDAFWVCWHWAHVTTDDLTCDNSNSKRNTRSHWRNVQFVFHPPITHNIFQKVTLKHKEMSPLTQDLGSNKL